MEALTGFQLKGRADVDGSLSLRPLQHAGLPLLGRQPPTSQFKEDAVTSGSPKVLVAVHGIGDQTHFETLQHLVNLNLGQMGLPKGVPIGFLHSSLEEEMLPWASVSSLPGRGF